MSAIGDRNHDKKPKKRRYSEQSTSTCDWGEASAEQIADLVTIVTATGCAIRFGYSRDRGAFAIGIIGDGDPYTVWAHGLDQLDIKIHSLMVAFRDDKAID